MRTIWCLWRIFNKAPVLYQHIWTNSNSRIVLFHIEVCMPVRFSLFVQYHANVDKAPWYHVLPHMSQMSWYRSLEHFGVCVNAETGSLWNFSRTFDLEHRYCGFSYPLSMAHEREMSGYISVKVSAHNERNIIVFLCII